MPPPSRTRKNAPPRSRELPLKLPGHHGASDSFYNHHGFLTPRLSDTTNKLQERSILSPRSPWAARRTPTRARWFPTPASPQAPSASPSTSCTRNALNSSTRPGQYQGKTLLAMMNEGVASGEPHVKLSVWDAPGQSRPTFEQATSHAFRKTFVGEFFGPSWSTHWFKVILTVPEELREKEVLELHWDANNEGMVWSEDGKPLQGLTGGGERVEFILPDSFRDGKEHTVYVEMACNGMFGNAPGGDAIQPPQPDKYFQLSQADIVAVNPDARQLRIDVWMIRDAALEFPEDSWEQHKALNVCNDIINAFELGNKHSLKECRSGR